MGSRVSRSLFQSLYPESARTREHSGVAGGITLPDPDTPRSPRGDRHAPDGATTARRDSDRHRRRRRPGSQQRHREGYRAVVITGLRLSKEAFLEALAASGAPLGELASRALVRIALPHLHQHERDMHRDARPSIADPVAVYWRVGDDGLLARCFHLHPLMVDPIVAIELKGTVDGHYLSQACPDPYGEAGPGVRRPPASTLALLTDTHPRERDRSALAESRSGGRRVRGSRVAGDAGGTRRQGVLATGAMLALRLRQTAANAASGEPSLATRPEAGGPRDANQVEPRRQIGSTNGAHDSLQIATGMTAGRIQVGQPRRDRGSAARVA